MNTKDSAPSSSISAGFASAAERNAWLDSEAAKRGFRAAPPDHAIYSEGPTVVFVSSRKPKKGRVRRG